MPRRAGFQKGFLREESGSWIGYWNERVFDTETRKARWIKRSIKICPLTKINPATQRTIKVGKKEAWEIFNETVLSRLQVRSTNPPALATVKELWDRKVQPQTGLLARKSQEHWRNMLDNHILPAIGQKQLRDVRVDDVQSLIMERLARGSSPQTVWHIRTTISTLFKRAKAIGWYSGDLPTDGVQMPKLKSKEREALPREQLTALISGLPSPAREMVAFLAMTGLRKSELQGLRRRRVNLTAAPILCDGQVLAPFSIAVREQFVRVWGKKVDGATEEEQKANIAAGKKVERGQYQELKTRESGRRDIPLATAAVDLLRQVMAESKWKEPKHPVWAAQNTEEATPINADNVLRRQVKPVLEELGLPLDVCWHTQRHTQSTLADQSGFTEGERQKILGHANRRMTQRYTHAQLEHARAAMEELSGGFAEALAQKPQEGKVVEIHKAKRKAG